MSLHFERRIGPDPHREAADGSGPIKTPNAEGCPDVWQVSGGDYAVIGRDITSAVARPLPSSAGCGPDERIVLIPRDILEAAARDLMS
jgi:hypothetical protein